MKKLVLSIAMLALVGCQTAPKNLSPASQAERLKTQLEAEQKTYDVAYREVIKTPTGDVQLVGRNCKYTTHDQNCARYEDSLNLVENKTAKKAGAAIAVGVLATLATGMLVTDRVGFNKDELKGTTLEPKLPNNAVDYAKPLLENWIRTAASQYAPANQPITKVTVQPERFYLVYEHLTGEKTYQLRNTLHIGLQNGDFAPAYWYHCTQTSAPKSLPQWQANNYNEVKLALQRNVQQCVTNIASEQKKITKFLSK